MKVRGTQEARPLELDITSSPTTIYVRENIQRIETEDFVGWEYDERTFPSNPTNVQTLTAAYAQRKARESEEMAQALTVLGVDVDA